MKWAEAKGKLGETLWTEPLKLIIKWSPALLCTIVGACIALAYPWLTRVLSFLQVLVIASIELLLSILLGTYVIYLRRIINQKPVFRFGAFWDADANPLCQVCNTYLSFTTRAGAFVGQQIHPWLECRKCRQSIQLIDEQGRKITLPVAQEALRKKN